jgi:hypothetical protein
MFNPRDPNRQTLKTQDTQRIKNCQNTMPIIAACYAKLVWDKMNVFMQSQVTFEKVNEICEQLTLVTDLFACIMHESPTAMRKDACDAILYFSHQAVENLKRSVIERTRDFSLAF